MEEAVNLDTVTQKLERYVPPADVIELVQHTPILLLVGIAGAGKDTLKHRLLESGEYHHIVSHTTRAPRLNNGEYEQDGVDYHFVNMGQALAMVEQGQFVEAKVVHRQNIYGTSVAEVEAAHRERKIAVTDIEVQGVAEYKSLSPNVLAAFILPPSYDVWMQRLQARYGEHKPDEADLHQRMETAVQELKHAIDSDYFVFVMNDQLDETAQIVNALAHGKNPSSEYMTEAKSLARELLHHIQATLRS